MTIGWKLAIPEEELSLLVSEFVYTGTSLYELFDEPHRQVIFQSLESAGLWGEPEVATDAAVVRLVLSCITVLS